VSYFFSLALCSGYFWADRDDNDTVRSQMKSALIWDIVANVLYDIGMYELEEGGRETDMMNHTVHTKLLFQGTLKLQVTLLHHYCLLKHRSRLMVLMNYPTCEAMSPDPDN